MHTTINDNVIEYFSHNVTYLRKTHNISKKEMSKILGIGIKTLNKLEQGILPPKLSIEVLFRILEHFGIPLDIQVSIKIEEIIEK